MGLGAYTLGMDQNMEVLVEGVQKVIEGRGDPYLKALRIVKEILIPAVQSIKDEYQMLEFVGPDTDFNIKQ